MAVSELDREVRAAGYPQTTTIPGYGVLRLRIGRIAGSKVPMAWTDGHEKQFSTWWGQTGRRLGLSPSAFDLRAAFYAGFRSLDPEGRPVFVSPSGRRRTGVPSEVDAFRHSW